MKRIKLPITIDKEKLIEMAKGLNLPPGSMQEREFLNSGSGLLVFLDLDERTGRSNLSSLFMNEQEE